MGVGAKEYFDLHQKPSSLARRAAPAAPDAVQQRALDRDDRPGRAQQHAQRCAREQATGPPS